MYLRAEDMKKRIMAYSNEEIDRLNVLRASQLAMCRALADQ